MDVDPEVFHKDILEYETYSQTVNIEERKSDRDSNSNGFNQHPTDSNIFPRVVNNSYDINTIYPPHNRYFLVGDMLYSEEIGQIVSQYIQVLSTLGWKIIIGDPGRSFVHRSSSFRSMKATVLGQYKLPKEIKDQNNGLAEVIIYGL